MRVHDSRPTCEHRGQGCLFCIARKNVGRLTLRSTSWRSRCCGHSRVARMQSVSTYHISHGHLDCQIRSQLIGKPVVELGSPNNHKPGGHARRASVPQVGSAILVRLALFTAATNMVDNNELLTALCKAVRPGVSQHLTLHILCATPSTY